MEKKLTFLYQGSEYIFHSFLRLSRPSLVSIPSSSNFWKIPSWRYSLSSGETEAQTEDAEAEVSILVAHQHGHVQSLSCVRLFVSPRTVAHQAPLSMGILQARLPEWVAISSSRGPSQPRDRTRICISCVFCIGGFFTTEPRGKSTAHQHHLQKLSMPTLHPRPIKSGPLGFEAQELVFF